MHRREGKYAVSGFRAKLTSPASAGILFVLTVAADVACLPLAVLARQAMGNNLIFLAAVALLALVLGGVGVVVPSCVTGCTRSTGSSRGRWRMRW